MIWKFICLGMVFGIIWYLSVQYDREWPVFVAAGICTFAAIVIYQLDETVVATQEAEAKAKAAQEARDAQPHVIREADGCKVYAFKSGSWHYFTRCPNASVTTDRSYQECVSRMAGKTATTQCTDKIESINTRG